MSRPPRYLPLWAALLAVLAFAATSLAQPAAKVRFGYLPGPGSALFLVADAQGLFKEQGIEVSSVPFGDSATGLAGLAAGKVDLGAFAVGETLKAIAQGARIRIIAGGGTDRAAHLLDGVDASAGAEREESGIVVAVADVAGAPDKEVLAGVVTALIKAHVQLQSRPEQAWSTIPRHRPGKEQRFGFDPEPEYWRLAGIWQRQGHQSASMPRDYLADHVYDEIYCDALRDLNGDDGTPDPVIKELARKAVCPPDCCPTAKKKASP